MNTTAHHTGIIKVGNSKDIRIPIDYHVSPLKEWDKHLAAADTTTDEEFKDWDITLADGIE